MTYTIHTGLHSIEECKRAVEELHKKGYKKEQITLVTNNAYQEAILENWDLRGADGAIISSHSLLEKVKDLFNLKQYEAFQNRDRDFPQRQGLSCGPYRCHREWQHRHHYEGSRRITVFCSTHQAAL